MSAPTPGQALADAWEAQARKCDEAAQLPGLAKAAALEQATFAAQLRDCARQLRDVDAAQAAAAARAAEWRAVLEEVFTCLDAGDPALPGSEQVAEWRKRAGMEGP